VVRSYVGFSHQHHNGPSGISGQHGQTLQSSNTFPVYRYRQEILGLSAVVEPEEGVFWRCLAASQRHCMKKANVMPLRKEHGSSFVQAQPKMPEKLVRSLVGPKLVSRTA
jgi:hypothetical protein